MQSYKVVAIIPARWGSTRFEGKPLYPILGIPMIKRVFDGVKNSKYISDIYIATDDIRICDFCKTFTNSVVMTDSNLNSGTDRVCAVINQNHIDADLILNVQGDEPLIKGEILDALIDLFFINQDLKMATLARKINSNEEIKDYNTVKVLLDDSDFAFSFFRDIDFTLHCLNKLYVHIGIYAYKKDFLLEFNKMKQTKNELNLKLEQYRALDNNVKIKVKVVDFYNISVDVPEDIKRVEDFLLSNN